MIEKDVIKRIHSRFCFKIYAFKQSEIKLFKIDLLYESSFLLLLFFGVIVLWILPACEMLS